MDACTILFENDRPVRKGNTWQDSCVSSATLPSALFGTITKFLTGRTPGTLGPDRRLALGFET